MEANNLASRPLPFYKIKKRHPIERREKNEEIMAKKSDLEWETASDGKM